MFVESPKEVALDTYAQVRFVEELRTLLKKDFLLTL